MQYLIAYDIADPKRLKRIGRFMEKRALRCQKSVFWFEGDATAAAALLDEVRPLLDLAVDVVQAWQMAQNEKTHGLALGVPLPLRPASVVAGVGQPLFVEE